MVTFTISIADKRISVEALYPSTRDYCRNYLTDAPSDFSVSVTEADITFEREKSAREDAAEGIPTRHFPDEYLETLAVYRKIAEEMVEYDTLLFHGSVISVDGVGYLFTAKSGTGKSTHTRFWREQFGDRAVMVNDDKPLLRIMPDGVFACGTPWDGKHHLSTNTIVPLRAICILERGIENEIVPVTPKEALQMLLQQTHRPAQPQHLFKMLHLVDDMTKRTGLYRLKCNLDPTAALVAYEGMNRKDQV